jgi:hypothetical protein
MVDWKNLSVQEKNAFVAVRILGREYWPGRKHELKPDWVPPGDECRAKRPPEFHEDPREADRLLWHVMARVPRGGVSVHWEPATYQVVIDDYGAVVRGAGLAPTRSEAIVLAVLDFYGVELDA